MSQASFVIRPAAEIDFECCLAIDASLQTNYVWQMDVSAQDRRQIVRFQTARLPHSVHIPSAYDPDQLLRRWQQADYFVVSEDQGQVVAYLVTSVDLVEPMAWVSDLVVAPERRRQGCASELLAAASDWATTCRLRRLTVALQTRNYPAIQFLVKNGFTFSGYHEYYYQSGDIALFFSVKL